MSLDLANIRNIGIAAHIDAGKTTTTERILFYTRRTHRVGEVDDGTTTTDFDEQEQRRGITIYSAAVSCPWRGHTINLIDTPGHVDFTAEVERALRVLDGMVAVFDAKEGVEAQSETVWRQADKYDVPRICFINKMDRLGADFDASVASLRERLGANPLVLHLPMGAADEFNGLIDLVEMKVVRYEQDKQGTTFKVGDIPEEWLAEARKRRHELIETLAETSDAVMEQYLRDEQFEAGTLRRAIREATIRRELFPVFCGSALRHIGIQRLLDAVCDYLPSPLDIPPVVASDTRQPDVERTIACKSEDPVAALVFKIVADKPVDLYYVRIYAGTLKTSVRLVNGNTGEKENITRIFRMFAKRRDQLDEAYAGDIVAVIGPKRSLTGHTLCDQRHPIILETISFPETVISISVEPRSSKDRDKLLDTLKAFTRQDPTLSVQINEETGQILLSGMGELHLDVLVQRLRSEKRVDVSVGTPRVSYRETVTCTGVAEGRFSRQIAGREHFASVRLQIEPSEAGRKGGPHFEIVNTVPKERLLPEHAAAIEAGITEAAQSGVLGGYPTIDWKATVLDVIQHDRNSSELAFENAARAAWYDAMAVAGPVLLEPIMDVQVVTSDDYFGAIISDLNARRADVRDAVSAGSEHVISAAVPLSQMFGYVTKLRSLSQGRATSTMSPSHYAPVAADKMKQLVG